MEAFASTLDQPVRLPVFEGPLDLLLFLIRRNEVDIYDIPIGEITRQYLDILNRMDQMRLDVAGDFLVMAATLMQIKSRMLLPVDQRPEQAPDDEGEDPRWELVQQLLEYQRFKKAAAEIGQLADAALDLLPRNVTPTDEELPPRPLQPVSRLEVWTAFNTALRRLAERIVVGSIEPESVTVADRMELIIERLQARTRFRFTTLFPDGPLTLALIAATFLAILELARLGQITLRQDAAFEDIEIEGKDEG